MLLYKLLSNRKVEKTARGNEEKVFLFCVIKDEILKNFLHQVK